MPLSGRFRCILWCVFVTAVAQSRSGADSLDARFLDGLRERRLFELAEAHCIDRLNRIPAQDAAHAELTVELIRTLTLHAIHAAPGERTQLWAKARSAAATFARQSPPHTRALLVRIQDALTLLAQGELGRQEFEAGALSADQLEPARQALRQATGQLEALDKELTSEIPLRRRSPPRAGALTADELTSLSEHVQHELARAQKNRALLFERGSDDRLSLLLAGVQTLDQLLPQVADDQPLKPAIALDLAECQRLLGRYPEANELAAPLDRDGVPNALRLKARAELIRLALAQNNFDSARRLIELGRATGSQASAELDFSWFEAFLAFARAARQGQTLFISDRTPAVELARTYEREAAQAAELLDQAHGPYWGRRASQLLVTAVPRGSVQSVELLSRTAESHYLRGDFDQAIAAYDDAAGQARRSGDPRTAFELAYKAALVEQQRERPLAAADRLRILAKSLATHPQAPQAHLLAAWNVAQAARTDSTAGGLYE